MTLTGGCMIPMTLSWRFEETVWSGYGLCSVILSYIIYNNHAPRRLQEATYDDLKALILDMISWRISGLQLQTI